MMNRQDISEADWRERPLRIWQQNCRKSDMNQFHVINQLDPKRFDICFIQEPHIDFLGNTKVPNSWTAIYPPTHYKKDGGCTRSITLVSPYLSSSNWMDLRIDLPDVTAIQIWGKFGTIRFFNIYNDCNHSKSIDTLKKW